MKYINPMPDPMPTGEKLFMLLLGIIAGVFGVCFAAGIIFGAYITIQDALACHKKTGFYGCTTSTNNQIQVELK